MIWKTIIYNNNQTAIILIKIMNLVTLALKLAISFLKSPKNQMRVTMIRRIKVKYDKKINQKKLKIVQT